MVAKKDSRNEWDGAERRKQEMDDHDSLIVIGVKIEELSRAVKSLATNHENLEKRIDWLYRIVWIVSGVLITLEFLMKYLTK